MPGLTIQERFAVRCVKTACHRLGITKPVRVVFCELVGDYLACSFKKMRRIEFDTRAVNAMSDYDICEIAMHECCHLKNKIKGHGKSFQKLCAKFGADASDTRPARLREYGWMYMVRED